MAKFSSKNVEFLSGQKAIFGSNDDSSILWNNNNTELTITTVVSGVDPTDPGHLITRRYFDDELSSTVSGSFASTLVARSSNFAMPTTFTDVAWDVTHVESDDTVVKHDDTNTDNVVVYQNGLYLISFSLSIDAASTESTFDIHIRKNDTTVVPGSLRTISEDDEINAVSNVFTVELEADDFVTLQIRSSDAGDVMYSSSNFMVTKLGASQGEQGEKGDDGLPGTGSTINILEDGTLTASGVSHLNFEGNLDVTDLGSGHATVTISGSPGVDNLSLVQIRRTTAYVLTTSYTNVTFNTTDEETFSTVIEHDNTNTERINIKSDGTYLLLYDFSIDASDSVADVTYTEARILENNTTSVNGSWARTTTFNESSLDGNPLFHNHISNSCIVTLSAGDYLTCQLRYSDDPASTATNGTFKVIKLEGIKGSDGGTGVDGEKGDTGFGLFASARVDGDGTVRDSFNLSVSRSATGTYNCTFTNDPNDAYYGIHAQPYSTVTDTNAMVSSVTSGGFTIMVGQGDNGSAPDILMDIDFSVIVFDSEGSPTLSGVNASFLDLKDTPTTYSGSVGDYLRVTSSGIEFDSIIATGDHGGLTGLGDDDHTQYHNTSRADTWLTTKAIDNLSDVDASTPLDEQVLTWSGGSWVPTHQVAFSAGSMGEWEYKGTSGDTDPGSKKFKVNNSDQTLVTGLYVSDNNRADVDLGNFLDNFEDGDKLYLQKTNDSEQAYLYSVTSVTDNTNYHTFSVTYDDDSGVVLSDKDKITFVKLPRKITVVEDHGGLLGLDDDDHPQYLTRTDFTTSSGYLQDDIDNHVNDTSNPHSTTLEQARTAGNIMTGGIVFNPPANMTVIDISAANRDLTWMLGHSTDGYGWYWQYTGTGSGDANYLYLYSENGAGTDFWHMRHHQITHDIDINCNLNMEGTYTVDGRNVSVDGTTLDDHVANISNPHSVDDTDILPNQAGNSGKVLGTDGSNTSWVTQSGGGSSDHGNLSGLDDDDHTQYLLEDGSRELSNNWYYGSASISGSGSFYGNGATLSGVAYVDGDDVYFYDTTRSKDLGVAVIEVGCGRNSANTTNQYLRTFNGTPMNLAGIALPFDSTLVGITMSERLNTQTWTAQVGKNDSATSLTTLTITNAYENHTWAKDIDFSAGDRIQVYLSGTSIDYPQVRLYFRRKK